MRNKLIIDIGVHQGQDTDYFLGSGYRVIGIDAGINLKNAAKNTYFWYLKKNTLAVLS